MTWVAGADGFKRGWRVVLCEIESDTWTMRDVAAFSELLKLREAPAIVCVDMPIGLHEHTPPGGRECERLARGLLGPRRSSVFSAVGRQALACPDRADAHATSVAGGGIGVGAQAWGLAIKLREADQAMSPELQTVVFEVHPELCFWAMNRGQPMQHGKKTGAGENDRIAALSQRSVPKTFLDDELGKLRSDRDDFLDACAAAWTARRVFDGAAERLPRNVVRDGRGLDMAMWF
jgi:predicted RNase H-like nuclease